LNLGLAQSASPLLDRFYTQFVNATFILGEMQLRFQVKYMHDTRTRWLLGFRNGSTLK
jgi:hypothetical protein